MELQGKLIMIGEVQSFGTNGFTKLDAVIETQEQYPQPIKVEFHKDKAEVVKNQYKVGDEVKVGINLRGREYTKDNVTSYFNSIIGWKIEKLSNAPQSTPKQSTEDEAPF